MRKQEWVRPHWEDNLCLVGDFSPCTKQCFKWEGNQCKDLQIQTHNIWFCQYIELGFIGVGTFWILVLCIQSALCVWFLNISQGTGAVTPQEALELPETGAGRNKCHRKESLRVPWLYLLTGKENTCGAFAVALLPMLTSQGKENSWSVGLQGKISSEILNQLKKGKNTPWLQWVACETWEILCWFLWEFLAKPVHHSMSAGLFFPAGRHEALEDSWASSINASVL